MTEKFKIGDVVELKSGGPKMTVTGNFNENIHTAWFAGGKQEKGIFPFDAIVIYKEQPKN